jgi:hypothetical protein
MMQNELTLKRRAAQYVRMSTEHQQYSVEIHFDKIRDYTARDKIEIVGDRPAPTRTRVDEKPAGLKGCGAYPKRTILKFLIVAGLTLTLLRAG